MICARCGHDESAHGRRGYGSCGVGKHGGLAAAIDALRYAIMSWPELPYPDAPLPVRDLSQFDDAHRWALERMQRSDHPEVFPEDDNRLDEPGMLTENDSGPPIGDFWG